MTPPPVPGAGCGGAFLCDDFEALQAGTSPGAPNWSLIDAYNPTTGQTASVQVTTERAHGGLQSVFVSGANGRTGIIGSVPARNYYVRAWMFAERHAHPGRRGRLRRRRRGGPRSHRLQLIPRAALLAAAACERLAPADVPARGAPR